VRTRDVPTPPALSILALRYFDGLTSSLIPARRGASVQAAVGSIATSPACGHWYPALALGWPCGLQCRPTRPAMFVRSNTPS